MPREFSPCLTRASPIVRIIFAQATRHRASGSISHAVFDEQMRRLEREELEPKGLALLVRDLTDGRMRFLLKERSNGTTCDLLEFDADGTLETEQTGRSLENSSPPG